MNTMTDWGSLALVIIGFVGTALNVWITLRINNAVQKIKTDIAELKVWALEKFATKDELTTVAGAARSVIQLHEATARLKEIR